MFRFISVLGRLVFCILLEKMISLGLVPLCRYCPVYLWEFLQSSGKLKGLVCSSTLLPIWEMNLERYWLSLVLVLEVRGRSRGRLMTSLYLGFLFD